MQRGLGRAVELGRAVIAEVRAEQVTFLAGSIAYHAFVSLLPLLVLSLTAATTVGDASLATGVLRITESVLTEGASDLLLTEVQAAAAGSGVSVLGVAVLVWGTLRIFRGLDTAFSDIYESEAENTLVDQIGDGLLVFGTFALAVLAAGAAERVVPANGDVVMDVLHSAAVVGGLAVTFFPMFYVFPDVDVTVREIVPGVMTTAIGLTVLQMVFRVYLRVSSKAPTESAVTGVLVLLTFLYLAGFTILLGCVVNAVFANRSADVDVDPVIGGVQTGDGQRPDVRAAMGAFADLADASEPSLRVDDEAVSVPVPDAVRVKTGDDTVGVELRWRQSDAADPDGGS